MRKLTDNQKEFIVNNFFYHNLVDGWKVAMRLLTDGTCIVAGTSPLWVGGIGNFVKAEISEEAIGCLYYTFDLEAFLNSDWYREIHAQLLNDAAKKMRSAVEMYEDIKSLQS
jgi:hypothetical protein